MGGSSGWKLDYPVGYSSFEGISARVSGYFFLNPGWKKTRFLFSHTRTTWETCWVVRVYWVGRLRRRNPSRRWFRWLKRFARRRRRGISRWGGARLAPWRRNRRSCLRRRRRPRGGRFRFVQPPRWGRALQLQRLIKKAHWKEMAQVWSTQVKWIWCQIPSLRKGTLETLTAQLGYRLRGRFERRIRGVALPLLKLTRQMSGVTGASVRCAGRFTRANRAKTQTFRWGKLHRGNPTTPVGETFLTVPLRFGAVGVTLLVSYAG